MQTKKALPILSSLLIIGCASGPSGLSFESPVGVWNESWETALGSTRSSKVTIIDKTSGTYTTSGAPGRIDFYATDEQRKWKGFWMIYDGYKSCSEEKGGSQHWGVSTYQFNETFNRYTGTWDYCGDGQKFSTSGVR